MSSGSIVLVILDTLLALATLAPHLQRTVAELRDLFARAEAEGRDITAEEMAGLRASADLADAIWEAALARAKGKQGG